jgi:Family of unknown function (DUF5677)
VAKTTPLAAWLDFAEKLPGIAFSILGEAEVPETEKGARHPKVIAATLLIRTRSNFSGAIAMTRAQRVIEARVLTRCCFENLFYLAELAARGDEFVMEMHDDESKSRKTLGELILSEGITVDPAVKERLRTQLRDIKARAPQAKFLSITEVARGGLLAHSESIYRQLSRDAAHPTFTSLNRYIRRFEENGQTVRGLDAEPVVNEFEVAQTVNWACVAMIGICVAANQIFEGTPAGQQLLQIADEWQALGGS